VGDNSICEAMAGHATTIHVAIKKDGMVVVRDDGRGVPVGKHSTGKDALEVVHTVLHAGGKFGGGGYKVSGGLHGVGVSVVNAVSSRLVAEVDRNGKHYKMEFLKGGKPQGKIAITGDAPRGRTGSTITFWPDTEIFQAEGTEFRAQTVLERLQTYAFLNKDLE